MHTASITLSHCCVRLGSALAVKDITWAMRPGEHWALTGHNGAGKTTFLQLIRGTRHPAQGTPLGFEASRSWDFGHGVTHSALDARRAMALVSPDDQDAVVREDREMTVADYVCTGFFDSLWLFKTPSDQQRQQARQALETVGALHLETRSILSLSQGQGRRVLLARALVNGPQVLLLDEAFDGLDTKAQANLNEALSNIAASGVGLVMSTHHPRDLPDFITHRAHFEQGRIVEQGPMASPDQGSLPKVEAQTGVPCPNQGPALIRFENVSVDRGGQTVLHHLDWTLHQGQHWLVTGPNGAGKTTLTALCSGALRPTLGTAHWFDLENPVNIWDVRRRLGVVGPELQAAYRYNVTALELVLSGFYSSVGLYQGATAQQEERALDCLKLTGMTELAGRPIRTLSYGQLRRLIIARALAPAPQVLLLDEPCSGLDPEARESFLATCDIVAEHDTTLVYITHRVNERPACLTHSLHLSQGHVISSGPGTPNID